MKISLIICQYNCVDYLNCLDNWIYFKNTLNNWTPPKGVFSDGEKVSLDIYVLDGKFDDFEGEAQNSTDGSLEILKELEIKGFITLIDHDSRFKEHEVRNIALKRIFRDNPSDYIINWGIDEIPQISEINDIFTYVFKNPHYAYFNINYKNFVFDKQHYVLGFCPPRIFKVNYNGFQLKEFYWDDDVLYVKDGVPVQYKALPSNTIPKVRVNHYTWCDKRSKDKVLYQSQHFSNGFGCSFKWDDNTGLSFNMEYYKKIGQNPPEVYVINKNEKD